jgi:hypothetical protein
LKTSAETGMQLIIAVCDINADAISTDSNVTDEFFVERLNDIPLLYFFQATNTLAFFLFH